MDLAALVACLLAVHGLLLFSELHYRHRDYFSLALRRRPVSIFTPIAIEGVVGFAAVVWAVRPKTDSSQAQILGAALIVAGCGPRSTGKNLRAGSEREDRQGQLGLALRRHATLAAELSAWTI